MEFIKEMFQDKRFLKRTFAITIPIAVQNLLNNLLNMIDTVMISSLGQTEIAGVGLANKVFFVFSLLLFGVCSGSGILASQYYGKRELLSIKRVLTMSLLIGVGGSLLFVLPATLFPETVMRIFTKQPGTIAEGAKYLVIIALSYPLTAVTQAYVSILRSMNCVRIPVVITTVAIGINVVLNYTLIFGHFGMPAMGVAGAALATVIARIVECGTLMIIVFSRKAGDDGIGDFVHTKFKKGRMSGEKFLNSVFVKKYLGTASPVIANEFMWGLGVTMYSMAYGRMGDEAVAVTTITSTVENLALVFFFGICNAAAVILGNEMGANRLKEAEEHAKRYIVMLLMLTFLGAILTFSVKEPVISLFGMEEEVNAHIRICLTAFALYMPVRMMNCLLVVAILRSGGDTKAALFLDVSSVWLIGVPMSFLGGLVFKFPIHIVYIMISTEELYKFTLGMLRYKKKKWLRNIVAE